MKKIYLLLSAIVALSAFAADWKNSTFWSMDSTHPIPGNKVFRLIRIDGDFIIAGNKGIDHYKLENGKYTLAAQKKFKNLHDAVKLGTKIIATTSEGFQVWDLNSGILKTSRKACPEEKSYNMPLLAAVPKAEKVLFAAYNSLYLFDPEKPELKNLKIKMLPGKSAVSELPDGSAVICNGEKLYLFDGKLKELPMPSELKQKELYHIGVSLDGKYLYFGNPLTVYELSSGKIIRIMPDIRIVRWGYAHDTRRNELNVAGWTHISVLANADDPAKWEEIDRLGSTDEAALYTHRDVAPGSTSGSLCYLPESDELLFVSRTGITILGMKEHSSGLAGKLNWDKYLFDNSKITGDTAIHKLLRKRKMAAAWVTSSHGVNQDAIDNIKKSGINTIIHMVFQVEHGKFYPPHDVRRMVTKTAELCAANDIDYILCITPYNISMNNTMTDFRRFIQPDGTVVKRNKPPKNKKYTVTEFPCYLDRNYSEKAGMIHNMREFAKLAAKVKIAGIIFELGDGFVAFKIRRQHCICDSCFYSFITDSGIEKTEIPPAQRSRFLVKNKLWMKYRRWQGEKLAEICAFANKEMRKIAPDMGVGVMLPETASDYTQEWLYTAFIKGFQSKGNPVPVFSEQTYAIPYMPELCNHLDLKWKNQGLETILIPGQVNYWVTPSELQKRVKTYLKYNPGVYFYHNYQWYSNRRNEPFYAPMDKQFRKALFTLGDYIDTGIKEK